MVEFKKRELTLEARILESLGDRSLANFATKTIVIRSIFKKAFFARYKELGYPIKYHDDSGPKDHFEESDWVVAAIIYFGANVVRDLLKDKAKKGLNFLLNVTIETCKKAFSKKIYKISGRDLKSHRLKLGFRVMIAISNQSR